MFSKLARFFIIFGMAFFTVAPSPSYACCGGHIGPVRAALFGAGRIVGGAIRGAAFIARRAAFRVGFFFATRRPIRRGIAGVGRFLFGGRGCCLY